MRLRVSFFGQKRLFIGNEVHHHLRFQIGCAVCIQIIVLCFETTWRPCKMYVKLHVC
jgi:hypothetical protein